MCDLHHSSFIYSTASALIHWTVFSALRSKCPVHAHLQGACTEGSKDIVLGLGDTQTSGDFRAMKEGLHNCGAEMTAEQQEPLEQELNDKHPALDLGLQVQCS